MKVSLVIPAKGNSERLENKNLYRVKGVSLVRMACEKSLECSAVDNVYLDTESEVIISEVRDLEKSGLNIIRRPKELSNNNIGANDMMVYAMHSIDECDLILQTFSTSPMLSSETINKCVENFTNDSSSYDSFFTVIPVQEYFWNKKAEPINFDTKELPNSFDLESTYMETHGLYGIYTKSLIQTKTRVGLNPLLIPIKKIEAIDINDKEDLEILERLL